MARNPIVLSKQYPSTVFPIYCNYLQTIKGYYYTSDSLWKIWLVGSIQSIHNSLWTCHDKCNFCCRYCIYHVKFNVCLVTKPLGVFSSETKWLNASLLFLRMNYVKKCIIKQFLNSAFAWYHEFSKPRVCVICLSLRLRQITQTSVFDQLIISRSTSSNNWLLLYG